MQRSGGKTGPARPAGRAAAGSGFTLIEVLIALSIVALVAAVALPGLARRLDTAFSDADFQQLQSSLQTLPARVATLGIDLTLDAPALAQTLPDGSLPLDLPGGWTAKVETAPRLWHSGSCTAGTLVVTAPVQRRRWRLALARVSCEVTVVELAGDAA